MGLQAALDEFRNFESTLESMSMKIGGVEKVVATSIVNKLINPYLPDVNIIIEGFTLDMNLGFISPEGSKETWDADTIIKLYKLLPRFLNEFNNKLIKCMEKDIENKIETFKTFIFVNSFN